jgi:hypothetical protein
MHKELNMKKKYLVLMITAVTVMIIAGCATAVPAEEKPEYQPIIGAEGQPQPEWVNSVPRSADMHYETGYAKLSNKANSIQRANADAKEKISQWINTTVQSVIVNYTSDFGSGDDRQSIEAFESISRQVANNSLVGVTQEAMWVDQEGGVWVLAAIPIENTLQAFEAAEESFMVNEAAAYAEFKMNEALKMLEETLKQ